ncbi:type I restriction enzyme M protein [Geothermobacter ehrlichii]|uniref:site-specific DNA-methyltransferase (adenine-specific) n=1 Tax=Geothermobacter ehrlichii TaxID=213224 RepID=A0A5D3WJ68_9BACT|nr:class I SAM-dependent DNA methyltransferase [Geothermobacter ehrlichii]TYO98560.1 type I restriction enzyme M protein [Geothermobacter ehrlichii]
MNLQNQANFIWSVADLLRGDFKRSDFGRIILPFTLLRRLECVLEPTREAVLKRYDELKESGLDLDAILPKVAGQRFYNVSRYTLANVGETETRANLEDYIARFSSNARACFDYFNFTTWLDRLAEANLLYLVVQRFAGIDLHPDVVSNHEMGLIFEELIRRFAESANDTAGEYFTPRDVVRLATTLVFAPDHEVLTGEGVIRTIYDPCCGTGGFLASGIEQVHEWNDKARIVPYGQELNPESYAIAMADMLVKGYDPKNIKFGNTLSDDQLPLERFNYCLANPPFGVDWKKVQKAVTDEHQIKGFDGRFGPGLPRVSDGSLLFLMHLISKRRFEDGGTRIGIVLNGSPLFTGGAGSGESEIRRWILENDWLEAIVALPTDLFYNTGIATYIWILSNHKDPRRKGKVQLINATELWTPMRKSLGSKRRYISDEQIAIIARQFADFEESETSKIFNTTDFGYRRITVERPLQLAFHPRDELRLEALQADKVWGKLDEERQQALLNALEQLEEKYLSRDQFFKAVTAALGGKLAAPEKKLLQKHLGEHDPEAEYCKAKGAFEPNPDLRDYENVPLSESVADYFAREVVPHVPDAWIDESKRDPKDGAVGIVGYEINFNRYFYKYVPPRPLEEIDAELRQVEREIQDLLREVTE